MVGCANVEVANLVHYQISSIGAVHTRCKRCFRQQPDTYKLCDVCSVCGLRCFYDLSAYGGACYDCFATAEQHPRFAAEYIKCMRLRSDEYWDIMGEIDRRTFRADACTNLCEDILFGEGMLCEDAAEDSLGDVIIDDLDDARRRYAQFTAQIASETVNKISGIV